MKSLVARFFSVSGTEILIPKAEYQEIIQYTKERPAFAKKAT